jgi:hypothetical protein
MSDKVKTLGTRYQLVLRTTWHALPLALLLGMPSVITTLNRHIAPHFTGDRRGGSLQKLCNATQAHSLGMANLDSGTFFNTEFDI